MHMQGNPRTMQIDPKYVDVTKEVRYFLLERARSAIESGVSAKKIWIDPGIGFGKSTAHNIRLLKDLRQFVDSGYPVLLGTSRKSFIGRLLRSESDPAPIEERLEGTLATQALGQIAGVAMLRVHDVAEAARFRNVFSAITDAS
jgi:dihydropteroate synthase